MISLKILSQNQINYRRISEERNRLSGELAKIKNTIKEWQAKLDSKSTSGSDHPNSIASLDNQLVNNFKNVRQSIRHITEAIDQLDRFSSGVLLEELIKEYGRRGIDIKRNKEHTNTYQLLLEIKNLRQLMESSTKRQLNVIERALSGTNGLLDELHSLSPDEQLISPPKQSDAESDHVLKYQVELLKPCIPARAQRFIGYGILQSFLSTEPNEAATAIDYIYSEYGEFIRNARQSRLDSSTKKFFTNGWIQLLKEELTGIAGWKIFNTIRAKAQTHNMLHGLLALKKEYIRLNNLAIPDDLKARAEIDFDYLSALTDTYILTSISNELDSIDENKQKIAEAERIKIISKVPFLEEDLMSMSESEVDGTALAFKKQTVERSLGLNSVSSPTTSSNPLYYIDKLILSIKLAAIESRPATRQAILEAAKNRVKEYNHPQEQRREQYSKEFLTEFVGNCAKMLEFDSIELGSQKVIESRQNFDLLTKINDLLNQIHELSQPTGTTNNIDLSLETLGMKSQVANDSDRFINASIKVEEKQPTQFKILEAAAITKKLGSIDLASLPNHKDMRLSLLTETLNTLGDVLTINNKPMACKSLSPKSNALFTTIAFEKPELEAPMIKQPESQWTNEYYILISRSLGEFYRPKLDAELAFISFNEGLKAINTGEDEKTSNLNDPTEKWKEVIGKWSELTATLMAKQFTGLIVLETLKGAEAKEEANRCIENLLTKSFAPTNSLREEVKQSLASLNLGSFYNNFNAFVSTWNESNAETRMAALRSISRQDIQEITPAERIDAFGKHPMWQLFEEAKHTIPAY